MQMRYVVGIIIILISLLIAFIANKKKRKGKHIFVNTYSYRKTFKIFIITNCIIVFISFLIYYLYNSSEVAIGLGGFMIACSIAGYIRVLLMQSHIKADGGIKKD